MGLTFKPNTDDMRDSPSLELIPALINEGAFLNLYDPEGMREAKDYFKKFQKNIKWHNDAYTSMKGCDALIILTEWNQFRALDLKKVKALLKNPTLIDFRNNYNPKELIDFGFNYSSVGRPNSLFK